MARLSLMLSFLALAACSQPPSMVDMNAAAPNARAGSQGHPQGGDPHGGAPHGGAPHGGASQGGAPHGGDPVALEKCRKADWRSTGYRHGLSGYPLASLTQVTKACEGTGIKIDRLAYSTGRLEGLALFCSTESGYRRARAGQPVENNCPPTLAKAYEEGHARGVLHR